MTTQSVKLEMYYSGAWQDITAQDDVFTDPITLTRGYTNEMRPQITASSISATLANDDDRYRTTNPESPLYGLAGRATPVRVSVGSTVRAVGEIVSMAPDQTVDFDASTGKGRAWVDLEASGLLRRIGQWDEPLRSPFYTANMVVTHKAGYWPMEDPRGTPLASTPIPLASTKSMTGVLFDSQKRPPGSGPVADGQKTNIAYFKCIPATDRSSTDGWQATFVADLTSGTGSFYTPMTVYLADGYNVSFNMDFSTQDISIYVFDGTNSTAVASNTVNWGTYVFTGRWIMFVLDVSYSAGTTTVELNWRAVGEWSWLSFTTTYARATSQPAEIRISLPEDSAYGHVLATHGRAYSLLWEERFDALRGYAGETAADRFFRLCTLKGVAKTVVGDTTLSAPMGAQGVDTLINHFAEIVTTEDGMLTEDPTDLALIFTLRSERLTQTPALALTYPGDIAPPFREILDDSAVNNIVTASQRDGGDYTAEDSTTALGTQDAPDGVGEYRQDVAVNVYAPDTDLPQQAYWWLYKGTNPAPRFPSVTVDLLARPDLVSAVEAVDLGEVITITGARENVIRMHVIGWTEVIGSATRVITFYLARDDIFNGGLYDNTTYRYDSASTTLGSGVNSSAVSLTFSTTDVGDLWSTTDEPYDVFIAGERITVTSMGAASGSGPYTQTATVTRSVNGVVKSLSSGEAIHVANPGRYA